MDEEWTTVRMSRAVRIYLEENSVNYRKMFGVKTRESIDNIIRRILGIDGEAK